MSTLDRLRSAPALRAVLVAAVIGFAFETAVVGVYGALPGVSYLAFCAGLTFASALLVGAGFSLVLGRVEFALAVWVGLNLGFAGTPSIALSLATVAITWLVLIPARRAGASAVSMGVAAALAICSIVVIYPRVMGILGLREAAGFSGKVAGVGVLGVILLAHFAYSRLVSGRGWLVSPTTVSLTALVAMVVATPIASSIVHARHESTGSQPTTAPDAAGKHPTILLLVLDTVRADHLSLYGYERRTTPELERFLAKRKNAVVYPLAFSPATWTVPAHASLFTGQLPSTHGANSARRAEVGRSMWSEGSLIAESTLAEELRAAGYRTAGFLANPQVPMTRGLDRGFDVFLQPPATRRLYLLAEGLRFRLAPWSFAADLKPYPTAAVVNRRVMDFLDDGCETGSCFVLANYMEAHEPYAAESPFAGTFSDGFDGPPPLHARMTDPERRRRYAESRYDEEILALDYQLARLLTELEQKGVLERAWVVITSDHGEAFGDHDVVGHGTAVYNDQVHVPLIVLPPSGVTLPEYDYAVGLLDITATLSAVAGREPLGVGRDLRGLTESEVAPVQIEFFGCPTLEPAKWMGELACIPARAVVMRKTKLIEYEDRSELYELEDDPHERSDRAGTPTGAEHRLAQWLPPLDPGSEIAPSEERPLTAEEQEQLRALGYLE